MNTYTLIQMKPQMKIGTVVLDKDRNRIVVRLSPLSEKKYKNLIEEEIKELINYPDFTSTRLNNLVIDNASENIWLAFKQSLITNANLLLEAVQ